VMFFPVHVTIIYSTANVFEAKWALSRISPRIRVRVSVEYSVSISHMARSTLTSETTAYQTHPSSISD